MKLKKLSVLLWIFATPSLFSQELNFSITMTLLPATTNFMQATKLFEKNNRWTENQTVSFNDSLLSCHENILENLKTCTLIYR